MTRSARGTKGYSSRPLALTVAGQRVGGLAYVPGSATAASPAPLVVCCHGMDGSHLRVAPLAQRLAAQGAVAVCFDFRGGGGAASQGKAEDMSVLTELADLEGVLAQVGRWDVVDATRVALFGVSLGGAVAALAAVRHPSQVSALALWYPALGLAEDLRSRFPTLAAVPQRYEHRGTLLGRAYAADAWDLDLYAEVAAYRGPVLIIHGDQDRSVPLTSSQRAVRAFPDAQLVTVPGAGHGFGDERWERAVGHTVEFLRWNAVLD
ncbi:alpha/beta hydrolase family protein [Actinomyces wuliandei]|uniref:alpha/beta hydrolase family protein n=1 Tax=Actinomyces wuliandei TaxID=2057743 RepID=UPI001117B57F|nr:alpha/beta fold hydrolase [Actinomyces wuliandei]